MSYSKKELAIAAAILMIGILYFGAMIVAWRLGGWDGIVR